MNKLNKMYAGLLALGLTVAASSAHALPSAFADAVNFTQAGTDVNAVGVAVITFTLLMVGFAIVWRMAHSAKRA